MTPPNGILTKKMVVPPPWLVVRLCISSKGVECKGEGGGNCDVVLECLVEFGPIHRVASTCQGSYLGMGHWP